jgi:hypothetical protein
MEQIGNTDGGGARFSHCTMYKHTASSTQSRLDELDSRWEMFQEILISNIVCMNAMMLEVGKNLIRLI